jgi:hypothetical protein
MGANTATVQKLYVAFFNRPGDALGQAFWEGKMAAGMTEAQVAAAFATSTEYTSVYGSMTTAQIVSTLYTNLFARSAAANEITFWGLRMLNGQESVSSIALALANNAQNSDATAIANKISAATSFTNGLTTAAQIVGYSGAAANTVAKTWLATVTSDAATLTAANTSLTATITSATTAGTNTTGSTFTLTTGIDTLTGTSGNDTFVTDSASMSAADTITGGGGTDTFKVYGATVAQQAAMPTMNNIANVYFNAPVTAGTFDASGNTGISNITYDATPGTSTVKVTTGQSVTLQNHNPGGTTFTVSGNTPTSLNMTLNTVTAGNTIDFSGTALATVNFTATGGKVGSTTLTDTGAKITKLTFAGDKGIALVENAATSAAITTVDASSDTGGVKLDKTAGAAVAAYAFTGGSGDDILLLKAGDIATLTAGTQIAMGTGTDKVGVLDLTAAMNAAWFTKVNAMTGVEVLGLNAAQAIDASQLTSIKSFSLDTDAIQALTNMATGSKVTVTAAHTATFGASGAVGVSDLSLQIGQAATATESATAGLNNTGVFTIGQTSVALASLGTNAAANQLTVANADNSTYTVTGSNDLTLTLGSVAPTAIGSKVDATNFTGKLVVTGNTKAFSAGSSLGDVLIGGSGADTIKAAVNGGTLTGNAGNDTFDVSVALGGVTATFQTTTITDFTKGDKIKFVNTGTSVFTAAKVDLSGAATVGAALDLLAAGAGNVNGIVKWGTFGGNTYIVNDNGAGATFAATDIMVKLTGTLDLSTSTYATDTLTFA